MPERSVQNPEEEQLLAALKVSEGAGKRAKQLLLKIREQKLPELPTIRVWGGPSGIRDFLKDQSGLLIEPKDYGKEFSSYSSTEQHRPSLSPITVLADDGIYEVPVMFAMITQQTGRVTPVWEERKEIGTLAYLAIIPKTLEAINKRQEINQVSDDSA